MAMEQRQNLTGAQRQEQVMNHHQIQALELLSQPVLELQSAIDEEIARNPVIETDFDGESETKEVSTDDEEWLEKILKLDEESRYIRSKTASKYSGDDEERRQHYLDSVTTEQTFQESLLEQLKFFDLPPEQRSQCEFVISGLNDDGYLTSTPADLAMAAGCGMEPIAKAVEIVQTLDPPGVAAVDLRERLLIQLRRKGLEKSLIYRAVHDHLDDIANNRLPLVARSMDISMDDLKEVIAGIQSLNPRLVSEAVSPHEYVKEEVDVSEENGQLAIRMHNDYLPSLRISSTYRELLKNPNTSREDRDYIKDKIRGGVYLINSVLQRQSTIKRIVNAIVEWQNDYFLHEQSNLRPMTMAQIAEKAGIHETTVSRAVAGKYLKCKHGLVSMRGLFSTGYESEDGGEISNTVVKNTIREMIAAEDPYKPLSDSEISVELKKRGFTVARRTIVKYRESMNILSSLLRKQY